MSLTVPGLRVVRVIHTRTHTCTPVQHRIIELELIMFELIFHLESKQCMYVIKI